MHIQSTLALLAVVTLGLAGCGDSDQALPDTQPPASETSATDEGKTTTDAVKDKLDAARQSAAAAGDQVYPSKFFPRWSIAQA